jgi:hypothetical protein
LNLLGEAGHNDELHANIMIYTITLNPALDRTISINATSLDDCNRIENEQMYAGGKGIDVRAGRDAD